MKRTKDSLRDLWDNIKCTNIKNIRVQEEKEKGHEKNFEDYIENFPNMEKEIGKLPVKEFRIIIEKMIKNLENKTE